MSDFDSPCPCPTTTGGKVHDLGCPFNPHRPVVTTPQGIGWVCPNCGMSNAPWVAQCCQKLQTTTHTEIFWTSG